MVSAPSLIDGAGSILVVEDEVLIQVLAVEYLEESGFKVETADSATDALHKLQQAPGGIRAAIIDVGLPDRSGDALAREIKALHPALPIVLATGHRAGDFRDLFKDVRGMAYLSKPYTAEQLVAALGEAEAAAA